MRETRHNPVVVRESALIGTVILGRFSTGAAAVWRTILVRVARNAHRGRGSTDGREGTGRADAFLGARDVFR